MNNGVCQLILVAFSNKNNESSDNLRQFKERKFVPDSNLRMNCFVHKI